jgi:uncharacterized protein YutE (UPF0331/DUF86 family)/rRNA-processing protein FCF1
MTDKNKEKHNEFDIFIANSIFPEVAPLFSTYVKSLETIKSDAIVVLDTNALLVPYSIGKESVGQIRETYKKLVLASQLIIPGQVAREFANNRANKILELFQQLTRKQSSVPNLQKGKYPLLESLPEYTETIRLEKEIDSLLKEYRKAISSVLDHIRSWTWNDPVSCLYSELFTEEMIFDLPIDKDEVKKELRRRQIHQIPPGYKDASKDDSGIGDLLIWFTILEIGKSKAKDVIFVSGDQKTDWWHRVEGQALYPRYELIDEFRRESGGNSLHIVQFSRFLDLYGASESAVEEVREEEGRLSAEFSLIGEFIHKWQILEKTLLSKYHLANPNSLNKWQGPKQVSRRLYEQNLINESLLAEIQKLSDLRNAFVHDRTITMVRTESEIKEFIIRLDELIILVSQISAEDTG